MRSRTEMVTNTLEEEGSDVEEETDLEDSEEDWKPEKVSRRPVKITMSKEKSFKRKRHSSQSSPSKKRGRPPKVYSRNSSSEESSDSDNSDNQPIQSLVKKTVAVKEISSVSGSSSPKDHTENLAIQRPLQRKTTNIGNKSFPDRNGIFELLVCKSELKDGIKKNLDLCLWRRDGTSLLQKYIRDRMEAIEHIFISTSVYSCWEDTRRNDFYEVRVQCFGEPKIGKVKVLNTDELEKISETIHTDDEDVEEELTDYKNTKQTVPISVVPTQASTPSDIKTKEPGSDEDSDEEVVDTDIEDDDENEEE